MGRLWLLFVLLAVHPAMAQTWGTDFYVVSGGSDALDCATPAEACGTIHGAAGKAVAFGRQPGGIQHIHVAAGGYNDSVNFNADVNLVSVEGAGSSITNWNNTPGSCGTVIANTGANIRLSGFDISAVGDPCGSAVYAQLGGVINISSDIVLGLAYKAQLYCEGSGSQVQVWQPIVVRGGGASNLAAAASNCLIEFNPVAGISVTFNPTQSYSGSVLYAMTNASIYLGSTLTWVNAVNGVSFNVSRNATIDTDGNGCSSLPGSLPGVFATNGVCQ